MLKVIKILAFFLLVSAATYGQDYKNAIGGRGGLYNGLTFKHFLNEKNAIEGILATRWRGISLTGLYEWQKPISEAGFSWFFGFGAHVGSFAGTLSPWSPIGTVGNTLVAGVDGIIGLEYVFEKFPLDLAIDYKPAVHLIGGFFSGDEFGLSARYYW